MLKIRLAENILEQIMAQNIETKKYIRFFKLEGNTHLFTIIGTLQWNEVAERMNKTLAERTKSIRLNVGLPKVFQKETFNKISFNINRSPLSAIDFKIPIEVWSNRLVDYLRLKIFGCPAYAHVQSGECSTLDSKSRKCILFYFEKCVKDHRL